MKQILPGTRQSKEQLKGKREEGGARKRKETGKEKAAGIEEKAQSRSGR